MCSTEKYNDDPVFYCKSCLSLRVKTVAAGLDLDYCDECGCTDIGMAHIQDWQKLYRERYGFDYLTKEIDNGRKQRHPIF